MIKILGHQKIYRKYPKQDWEFRAIAVRVNDNDVLKDVVYGSSFSKGVHSLGVEIYSGKNYVVGTCNRSYSNRYDVQKVPKKYQDVVEYAFEIYQKTTWSNKDYIDLH